MTNKNDLFGGDDLFSYFGGNFSKPSLAASNKAEEAESHSDSDASVAPRRPKKRKVADEDGAAADRCLDRCVPKEDEGDSLTPEEQEAMSSEDDDVEAADQAELGEASLQKVQTKEALKEKEKPVFNHTTYICYAGMNRPVTKYFTADKLPLLELEDVRKRLEKDHPELSKQRTKMDWDSKKNLIIPIVTGGKKGVHVQDGCTSYFTSAKELYEKKDYINVLAAKDGFFEIRENVIGIFVAKAKLSVLKESSEFRWFLEQLPSSANLDACCEGFKLLLPKIPEKLIMQLLSFFVDYADRNVEVMGVFYWDTEDKRYILDVPNQRVTKVSVEPLYSEFPPHYVRVAEIHSHNTMAAYFSAIDDQDEVGTQLYGVIGHLKKANGTIRFDICTRAGMAGSFIPLHPEVWMAGNYDNQEYAWNLVPYMPYPAKWNNRVFIEGSGRVHNNA
ncbi:hypothetical protein YDYSY3_38800 [Paenibacillus chitinolyticus]|uniref:hypothetical protein n=1 Tax=Paenibacillus chitinolyticus TaxID=79263 RepID=UPI0026E4E8F8|nr:hypothetical protein [Paenibacillus chitinolyticus]GKS12880.1 hypothetical protein YDYSY3_38800 [Paenibacillus chitinolyticus]